MTKLILGLATVSAIAMAAPAAAQYNQGYQSQGYQSQSWQDRDDRYAARGEPGVEARIDRLDARFQAGIESGAITASEARGIRLQLRDLTRLEARYSADGLTATERRELQDRVRTVREQIRVADGGSWDRYDRDESDDRYGYDDRGYRGDSRYGQGGPYEEEQEVCVQQSGVRGVLGAILGSDNCLRVGERVPMYGSLAAVPETYRGQFRDTGSVYHRWVDGRVVQIDGRTRTVTRIYDVGN